MRSTLAVCLALLSLLATEGAGQQLRLEGAADDVAITRLREIVERGDYLVLSRDTVLPATARIAGDLIVTSADVRLEGSVTGSVAVLPGGDFFLRPGGSVAGTVVSVGGGAYLSANASVGERLELPAAIGARLERAGEDYTLQLTPPPPVPRVQPTGIFGVGVPSYDRVNGATLRAGALLRPRADTAGPVLAVTALYHVERSRPGAQLVLALPAGAEYDASVEVARRTETNDAWIRGDLTNSLAALFASSDARDYREIDVAALTVTRLPPGELAVGAGFVAPRVRVAVSRARSLAAGDPWSLFGSDWRANPPIEEGTIASATVGAAVGWRGVASALSGTGEVELAPPGAGDFDFALLTLDGRWDLAVSRSHALAVRVHLLHPLGTRPPPQRWSILGGPGTLPTLEAGALRGDHLAFVESTYSVTVPALSLPLLGSATLFARHAVGTAWAGGDERPPLDQNVGAGVAFRFLQFTLLVDPTEPDRPVGSFSAVLPL